MENNPLNIPTPDREGGSPFGSSFIKSFRGCPKSWWYEFLAPHPSGGLGLVSPFLGAPLAIGIATHVWLEEYYGNNRDSEVADRAVVDWFHNYEGPEMLDIEKIDDAVTKLVENYKPFDKLNPLDVVMIDEMPMVEQNLSLNLGYNGYIYTARLDGVVTNREDGYNYILENKTVDSSRFSELTMASGMDCQLTGQILLAKNVLPTLNIQGIILNCLKKRVGKDNPNKVERLMVYRSPQALEKFRLDTVKTLVRIDESIQEYNNWVDTGMLPYESARLVFEERGGRDCAWCGYKEICLNPTKAKEFARPFMARSTKGFLKEHEV